MGDVGCGAVLGIARHVGTARRKSGQIHFLDP